MTVDYLTLFKASSIDLHDTILTLNNSIFVVVIVQNNFVEDVCRVSMENNFEIFRPMCDEVMRDIDQLVLRTRRLNVVDTDRRRIRRRRRRQGDDVVQGEMRKILKLYNLSVFKFC